MSCATMKASGIAAACSHDKRCGTRMASRASISAYSAKPPTQRPMTRSPTAKAEVPAAISPAHLDEELAFFGLRSGHVARLELESALCLHDPIRSHRAIASERHWERT